MSRITVCILCMALAVTAGLAHAREKVEVRFDVPKGLEAYTGTQPVTFGLPFEKGALKTSDGLRLVNEAGKVLPCQFEVTGTYGKESTDVRWLLVDALADIRNGVAGKAYLEFGPDVIKESPKNGISIDEKNTQVDTGAAKIPYALPIQFTLTDGAGKTYKPAGSGREAAKFVTEKAGPVRAVTFTAGDYRSQYGASIAKYSTRVRYYSGARFVRIYHTIIWAADEKVQLGGLKLKLPDIKGGVSAGLDGQANTMNVGETLFQKDWNVVGGATEGKQLDGWIEAAGPEKTFVALRWPWQQFPVSLGVENDGLVMGLIGPEQPMSLVARDAAVEAVKKTGKLLENGGYSDWDTNSNVPYKAGGKDGKEGWISPRGVSKTYEIVVWFGDDEVSAAIKNLLVQHPVFAYADPVFATRAQLPSPASAYDAKAFPQVEAALKRAFEWTTREQAIDGDFGLWNYGDIQWSWVELGGYTIYRYWMNNGKGWSIVPWALWLRSGDRLYYERAEANSRHVMDIDTCHLDDWSAEGKQRDGKVKGGVYHYCALHWAYGPRVLPFYSDTEYLPNYYWMTGYERAKDVLTERVDAIRTNPAHFDSLYTRMQNVQAHSRHLYAPTKDMLVFYEATWDPTIGKYAKDLMSLILKGQQESGQFNGVKTNHYLNQTLHIGQRVFGAEMGDVAIAKWTIYTGNNETGGPSIDIEDGWYSLWSQIVTGQQTGDARWLQRAARIMNAQAAVVDDSQTEWRGINPIFTHEIGPALRDWPIVMQALLALPAEKREIGYEPMTYICGIWPPSAQDAAAGWKYREIALVLDEKGEGLQLKVHMWGGGVGEMGCHVRVTAPDGALALNEDRNAMFAGQYGGKEKQTASGPMVIDLPAGKPGVYVLEVLMKDRRPFMHVRPSSGKIVYAIAQKSSGFLCSPSNAGQVWFQPAGGEQVVFSFPANQVKGKMTLFGPDGAVLAVNQVTGTAQVKAADHGRRPAGQPIRFLPTALGLHSFLTPTLRDKNCTTYISGCKPWFSARQSEWFDPAAYPCPNLTSILK